MGDTFRPNYTTKIEYACLDVDHILDGITCQQARHGGNQGLKMVLECAVNPMQSSGNECNGKHQADFENPCQELFIWSILMIQQKMAKLFWAEGKVSRFRSWILQSAAFIYSFT